MSIAVEDAQRLLIADTCSFLDIARSAWRHERPSGDVGAAVRLQNHAKDPSGLVIAVCDVSIGEFEDNIDGVETDGRNDLANLRKRVAHADEVATHLRVGRLSETTIGWDERILKAAIALSRGLIIEATVVEVTQDDRERAYQRSRAGKPPARRGARNMVDCFIAECAMRVASVRLASSTYFLTSNTRDFGVSGRLHPDLEAEFNAAGLVYTTTWSEVAGRLHLA
jgi:hypothetical protein